MASVNEKMTAIADGFRESRGLTGKINLDKMAELAAVPLGAMLPTLTNPGGADDLVEGKELIDQDGNVVTGTIRVLMGKMFTLLTPEFSEDGSKVTLKAELPQTSVLQSGGVISMSADVEKWTGGSY